MLKSDLPGEEEDVFVHGVKLGRAKAYRRSNTQKRQINVTRMQDAGSGEEQRFAFAKIIYKMFERDCKKKKIFSMDQTHGCPHPVLLLYTEFDGKVFRYTFHFNMIIYGEKGISSHLGFAT